MKTFEHLSALIPFVLGVAICGCSGGGGGGGGVAPTAGTGQLALKVTDAPLQDLSKMVKAEITVEKVEIHATSSGQAQGAATTQGNGNGMGQGQGNAPATTAPATTAPATTAPATAPATTAPTSNPNFAGAGSMGQGTNAGRTNPTAVANTAAPAAGTAAPATTAAGGMAGQGQGQGNGQGNGQGSKNLICLFDAAQSGGPKTYNLLDLRGGIMADLASAALPAGSYTHLVLTLSAAEVDLNGTIYSTANGLLTLPGGNRQTLTIVFQGAHTLNVVAGGVTEGLVDFDLSQSFNVQGPQDNPNSIQMSPVVRGANLDMSGNLAGLVLSDNATPADASDDVPLANALVTATLSSQNGQPVTLTTLTDAQGVYYLPGVEEGDWSVSVQAAAHDDFSQAPVTVAKGKQTTVDATLVKP